jgi:hypothetical protein
MEVVEWINVIISILSGIAVCIPLVLSLISFVKKVADEKRWNVLVSNVLQLMIKAEQDYEHGAEKKEYVMNAIKTIANQIGYNFDAEAENKVSEMIDEICKMAKVVNV